MKAVIFDMDGLLIDSEPLWDKSDTFFLKRKGFVYTPELRMRMMGTGQKEAIELLKKELGLKGKVEELIKERKAIFYNLFFKDVKLMKGSLRLIEKLSDRKILLAIATGGHSAKKVKEILRKFSLGPCFSVVVSSDEVKNGKPHPDVYLFSAKELGVKPSECFVLEDAANGVLAGKAAGMKVFGVNKNEEIREKLKEAGADRVFSSLLEINI